ncbi:MAG: hypothetical protein L3K09_06315 [Thermoplasmata archaeon]|nr:hypothetical protein [Thermoplasmata archaeon]
MNPTHGAARGSAAWVALGLLLITLPVQGLMVHSSGSLALPAAPLRSDQINFATNGTALANFSGALQRLVAVVGASGGAVLALVWARVALSWFSNDVTKKVQAKDRARDAIVGSLIFAAALTGLAWGLAHWVLTGA